MIKDKGYESGIDFGLEFYRLCRDLGCEEVIFYGFIIDNIRCLLVQIKVFIKVCIDVVNILIDEGVVLLVVGNIKLLMFLEELLLYINRIKVKEG